MLDYGGCYLYELVHARTVRGKKEKKNLSHAIYKMPFQHSVVNSFANLCYPLSKPILLVSWVPRVKGWS